MSTITVEPHRRHLTLAYWGVALCVALAVVCASAYALLTPLGGGSDEMSHWGYIQSIAFHGALPGAFIHERQQPPGYYLLGSVLVHIDDSLRFVRFLSVALGALTVLVTALAARRLWPSRPLLWPLCALLPAAIPEIQWLDGSVTNDSLALLAGALLVLGMVHVATSPPSLRLGIGAGLAIALGMLAKETDYSLIVVLLALIALRWRRQLLSWSGVSIAVIPLVGAGWWYLRNLVSFHSLLPPLNPLVAAGTAEKLRHLSQLSPLVNDTFQSLYGFFITYDTPIGIDGHWSALFRVLELLTLAATVAVLWAGLRLRHRLSHDHRQLALALAGSIVLSAAALLANSLVVDFQPQGRYILVAATAISLLLVASLSHLSASWPPRARGAALVGLVAVALLLDAAGLDTMHHLSLLA